MIKNCITCGSTFEARQSSYCLCSDKCRKIRVNQQHKGYWSDPVYRARHKKLDDAWRRRHLKIVPCKICGEPVAPSYGVDGRICRKYIHEECAVKEALEAIKEGAPAIDPRKIRVRNMGYSIMELREKTLNERGIKP